VQGWPSGHDWTATRCSSRRYLDNGYGQWRTEVRRELWIYLRQDPVHHFGARGDDWAQLMTVDKLGR
jgi:hypothetical protein